MQTVPDPPPPLAAPGSGDYDQCEESPVAEEDVLQDYCQQALLSDGLQRIDGWTYVVQDWDERLGILEVSLRVLHFDKAKFE